MTDQPAAHVFSEHFRHRWACPSGAMIGSPRQPSSHRTVGASPTVAKQHTMSDGLFWPLTHDPAGTSPAVIVEKRHIQTRKRGPSRTLAEGHNYALSVQV
jgi:hypothetical protein